MGLPWELTDDPAIWSAFADSVVALTAVAGAIFLLVDRFRPRTAYFGAWARSGPSAERNASQVDIYAVTMMAEPALLTGVAPQPGCEIALKPSNYSLQRARTENMYDNMPPAEPQLTWLPGIRFTQKPRLVGGPSADANYEPIATVFMRGPFRGRMTYLRLEFSLTSDPRRKVIKRVNFKARHKVQHT